MQITLRKIGNSRGVVIPSAIIEQLQLQNSLEMIVQDGCLLLKPLNTPRSGWFDGYDASLDVEPLSELKEMPSEDAEWEW